MTISRIWFWVSLLCISFPFFSFLFICLHQFSSWAISHGQDCLWTTLMVQIRINSKTLVLRCCFPYNIFHHKYLVVLRNTRYGWDFITPCWAKYFFFLGMEYVFLSFIPLHCGVEFMYEWNSFDTFLEIACMDHVQKMDREGYGYVKCLSYFLIFFCDYDWCI